MRASLSKEFKDTVKKVLANVEKKSGVAPDNPDFVALKRLLKRRVREVESPIASLAGGEDSSFHRILHCLRSSVG